MRATFGAPVARPRSPRATPSACAPLTEAVLQEAREAYGDTSGAGDEKRQLSWSGTPYLRPADAVRVARAALAKDGNYNNFTPSLLAWLLGKHPVCARFARESSVVVYVRGAAPALQRIAASARRARADEVVAFGDDGELRIWWD